jgi:rare lipoprotein A
VSISRRAAGVVLVLPALVYCSWAVAAGPSKAPAVETGLAAVYSDKLQGRKTASGERYDRAQMTAAHRTLPFGTRIRVTHRHRSITVRINDRGPFHAGRILDLSPTAAQALGFGNRGVGEVRIEVVSPVRSSTRS